MKTIALILASLAPGADADLFQALDRNHDGIVQPNEISATQRPAFDRALRVADFNEDGKLTAKELQSALSPPKPVDVVRGNARQFDITRLDQNKDGKLTKDEVPKQFLPRLEQLFTVYGKEIPLQVLKARYEEATPKQKSEQPNAEKNKSSIRQQETSQPSNRVQPSMMMLKRLDRNLDGRLSRSELPTFIWNRMKPLDRNSDGVIERAEILQGNRPVKPQPKS